MRFTVITGVYNEGLDRLQEAADSVLSQSLQDFEWIICDDGSEPVSYTHLNGAVDGGSDNVQTGENNNVTIAVVAVMFIAAAGIVVLSVKAKKVRAK